MVGGACVNEKTAVLTFKMEGVPEGTAIQLVPGATHKEMKPVAETAADAQGGFAFEVALDEPRLFYVRASEVRGFMSILTGPGEHVNISGTFGEPVVEGSPLHAQYIDKFEKPRAELNRLHGEIQSKIAAARKSIDEATDEQALAIAQEEHNAALKADSEFFPHVGAAVDKAIEENADSWWAPLLLLSHTAYLTPDNEEQYNMFSETAKSSYYGKLVAEEIFGLTGKAPAFTARDADGAEHTLTQLLANGNYVLVDFWASWCGPCRRFVPTLKELAVKYADKGLVVVSISTDKDRDAWLKALEEEGMPWLNLLDDSGISGEYGVTGIPSVFLIDPQGEIVFGKQSGQSVVDKLAKIFRN